MKKIKTIIFFLSRLSLCEVAVINMLYLDFLFIRVTKTNRPRNCFVAFSTDVETEFCCTGHVPKLFSEQFKSLSSWIYRPYKEKGEKAVAQSGKVPDYRF